MKPNTDPATESPEPNDAQVIVLKVPDGSNSSTTVEHENAIPPVKSPRVSFSFEEI